MEETILNQDNTSAILLETNGRQLGSRHTEHIHVRYFFIKDRVDNTEITLSNARLVRCLQTISPNLSKVRSSGNSEWRYRASLLT
jgi:hypothetical protein